MLLFFFILIGALI